MLGLGSSIFLSSSPQGWGPNQFVLKIKTNINDGESYAWDSLSSNTDINSFQIYANSIGGTSHPYFNVDWGDGTVNEDVQDSITHDYGEPYEGYIIITPGTNYNSGVIPTASSKADKGPLFRFHYGGFRDAPKITEIANWGCFSSNMSQVFYKCWNLTITATDTPKWFNYINSTGLPNNMDWYFGSCRSLTTENLLFLQTIIDARPVTSARALFFGANQLIGNGLPSLDFTSLTNANGFMQMFLSCFALDQDLSGWDMSNAKTVERMFQDCRALRFDISQWDITNVTKGVNFLLSADLFEDGSATTTAIYDATLIAWNNLSVQDNVNMHFGGATYTAGGAAAAARQALIDDHNWTITDGGTA
tara:strand:- start:814 stop:1899 length:1086 start_codon:yes stop_codon:yes gene_type:complete